MMTPENEKMCAAFILHLVLGDSSQAEKPREVSWEDLLKVAKRNVVIVRLADELERRKLSPPEFFTAAVEEQRRLNREKLELLQRISRGCEENGVEFIFAKGFHHYPDMGGDLDLFLPRRSAETDEIVLRGLNATPNKKSLIDRLAAARCYTVGGSGLKLEIHHGHMMAYGEHHSFVATLIKNARRTEVEGDDILIPSPEDLLVMQGTQRVYARSCIRLAPIVYTIKSLRRDHLDWDYVLSTARRFNAFLGLSCYLSYVNQIHREVFGGELLPAEIKKSFATHDWGLAEFKDGAYRFPHVRVARKVYLNMFREAALSGNWKSLSRLCLAPFVAATAVLRKAVSQ